MVSLTATPTAASEGVTERFDPIEVFAERVRHRAEGSDPVEPGRYLQVQGAGRTLTIAIEQEVVRIGRGLGADLRLDENSVSRRHAILDPTADGVRILDDRSSNGTFVNGERVQQAVLRSGDRVGIGRVVLRYLEV